MTRPRIRRTIVLAIAVCAATPATASATRCSSATERVRVTWGTGERDAGWGFPALAGLAERTEELSGVQSLQVRRDQRGGALRVCGQGRVLARLPRIGRDERLGAASTNGRYVAWRTWRPGRSGILRVGTVRAGRVRSVRSAPVLPLDRARRAARELFVGQDGLVAFSLTDPRTGEGAVRVWETGTARPRLVARVRSPELEVEGVRPAEVRYPLIAVDDATLEVAGRLVAFRDPTPGRCPVVRPGTDDQELAGWRLRLLPLFGASDDFDTSTSRPIAVCDPADGRTRVLGFEAWTTNRYATDESSLARAVRVGDGYVLEFSRGQFSGEVARGTVVAPTLGAGGVAAGPLTLPGETPAAGAGVVAAPGVLAWLSEVREGGRSRRTVVLADARGVRVLDPDAAPAPVVPEGGRRPPDVVLQDDVLRWEGRSGPREERVEPTVGAAFGRADVRPLR